MSALAPVSSLGDEHTTTPGDPGIPGDSGDPAPVAAPAPASLPAGAGDGVDAAELAALRAAVAEISRVCVAAAEGDLEPRVAHLGDDAHLVAVRASLNGMLDRTDAFVREASASLQYAADGRFFRRFLLRGMSGSFVRGAQIINRATAAMAETDGHLRAEQAQRVRLAGEFEQAVLALSEHVAAAATEMEATAGSLSETMEHAVGRTEVVERGAVQAADAVTSVASAVEELATTVASIEEQASASSGAGRAAVTEAERARETMHELARSSEEIGGVVRLINRVASQTKLLALNATIESARAGEAGRGFAVVASEVKELAAQTSAATEQIAAQIELVQTAAAQAVHSIDGIVDTIRTVGSNADTIALSVGEQRAATTEISKSTSSAADGVNDVSRAAAEVVHTNRDASTSAIEMRTAALDLSRLASDLRTEVEGFLSQIS